MPPSTQNSAPTLRVEKNYLLGKYSMFYKIVISLNIWFKRHGICKKKKNGHMKVQDEEKKIGTHEGPKLLKKTMST